MRKKLRLKRSASSYFWSCFLILVLSAGCSPSDDTEDGTPKADSSLSRIYKFTSDTSHYFSTSHEGKFVSNTDYLYKPNLDNIPFQLGDWGGEDLDSNDPNILYQRFYKNPKNYGAIYLMAVHGTNESQFHTPEVCYIGAAWKVEERRYKSIKLRDETFQVRYVIADNGEYKHLVLYWYLWPDSRRNITDGLVMLRLSVIIDPSLEEAEKSALDFIKQLSELKLELNKGDKVAETFTPVLPIEDPGKKPSRTEWTPYKEKAVAWLKSQIVPNSIVKEPAQDRRNLLISYKVPKDSEVYRYVFSKASLYDNALAVIAFSMVGEYSLAERIIEASSRVLSPDNDLWFTFNTHNSWPNKHDHGGAIVRSGASAWLGYAITFYLKTRLADNPNLLQQDNEAMNHLKLAQSIADKILLRQITDPADPRYGFFTGGEGRYSYRWNKESNDVEEYFIPGSIEWASIEHNIDIYFLLRDLALLTGKKKYASPANILKQSM
ncbi:MAG: EpsI family protein, partial [Nitrospinota bacterium]|nr:EpsI family protein [Nitrospinota bacterium]